MLCRAAKDRIASEKTSGGNAVVGAFGLPRSGGVLRYDDVDGVTLRDLFVTC